VRNIGVVTTSRSDYGICAPILRRLQAAEDVKLMLFVAGMHLSPEYGQTVRLIEEDGFEITDRIELLISGDSPTAAAKSVGLGTIGFAQTFSRIKPDVLVVVGDRFELLSVVIAALPYKIPLAHLHGGEASEGAFDDSIRHAITKMSHLHFVSNDQAAQRVRQMGEDPSKVYVTGAPGIDNLNDIPMLNAEQIRDQLGLDLQLPFLLVCYHPVTLYGEDTKSQLLELCAALREFDLDMVITYPNADPQNRAIIELLQSFTRERSNSWLIENLGTQVYFSLMRLASAMVGNSSSGLIEAPSFRLPVVNIGERQRGRLRAANVIDVSCRQTEIATALQRAISESFREGLRDLQNPYGDGKASQRIVHVLRTVDLGSQLVVKRFHMLEPSLTVGQ